MDYETWHIMTLLATAITFTTFGWWIGMNTAMKTTIDGTIDQLVKKGYLRSRIKPDGTRDILKADDKE